MLPLVRNVLFVTILTIAGIVTAANLGINVTPLLAGAGVIGSRFDLAIQRENVCVFTAAKERLQ
jgi:small-conductance mechanosensitive channel